MKVMRSITVYCSEKRIRLLMRVYRNAVLEAVGESGKRGGRRCGVQMMCGVEKERV